MQSSKNAQDYAETGRPDRRRPRTAPQARLWPGRQAFYPALYPWAWYRLYAEAPRNAEHLWLETAHGLTRVCRADVELRAEDG